MMIHFEKYKNLQVEDNIHFSVGASSFFNGMRIHNDGKAKATPPATVKIGCHFHSGKGCVIRTSDHDFARGYPIINGAIAGYKSADVTIGNYVWLGDDVLIMKGVTIGEGAIIQARSVVVSDIPALAIAGGHPCRVFSSRDPEEFKFLKSIDFSPVQSAGPEEKRAFFDARLAQFKASRDAPMAGAKTTNGEPGGESKADQDAKPRHRYPDFLIIGGMKCGTSSLGRNLDKHPQIFLANRGGEVHFFNNPKNKRKGIAWYLSHFPAQPGVLAYGEKTPAYIDLPIQSRLRRVLPNAKLIVILRDPVKRFQSHYNYFQRDHIKESVRKAHAKPFRIGDLDESWFDRRVYERGLYDLQLERLFSYFPQEQVHVCFLEDFRSNEQAEYDRIYAFLGVDSIPIRSDKFNVQDSYPFPLDPQAHIDLYQSYAPHNERLFQILGLPERADWKKHT